MKGPEATRLAAVLPAPSRVALRSLRGAVCMGASCSQGLGAPGLEPGVEVGLCGTGPAAC